MKADASITVIFIFAILIAAGVVAIFAHNALRQIQEQFTDTTFTAEANKSQSTIELMDWGLAMVTVMCLLAVIVTAYLIDSTPVLFFFSMLASAFVIIVVPILANFWGELSVTPGIAIDFAYFPIMSQIWQYSPVIATVTMAVAGVVLYAKGSWA